MPTMEQEINLDALFYMLKGEPSSRKSTQALSFPKPQFWFSWDQKMESLHTPMLKWGIKPSDISYENYSDWQKPLKKLEEFQLNCPYKTVVVDSITTATDAILRQIRKLKVGETRSSGKESGIRIGGIQVNELEDYKAEASALNELISILKDTLQFHKVNIVLIAHVIRTNQKSVDSKSNISRSIVTAAKKTAAMLPAHCSEIYHFDVESDMEVGKPPRYKLFTMHTGDDYARTTLPLPMSIEFNDKELYDGWIKPAIDQQRQQVKEMITKSQTK